MPELTLHLSFPPSHHHRLSSSNKVHPALPSAKELGLEPEADTASAVQSPRAAAGLGDSSEIKPPASTLSRMGSNGRPLLRAGAQAVGADCTADGADMEEAAERIDVASMRPEARGPKIKRSTIRVSMLNDPDLQIPEEDEFGSGRVRDSAKEGQVGMLFASFPVMW